MPLNGKFLDKSGLTYLWSKLKDLFSGKVDKEAGKGLSTNDYTTAEKTKLSGIETGANKTIVDSVMSSSSTNPVQNRVINTALSGKQNTLTFDSTPTDSSTNPVTSVGVYTDQQRQETEIGVVANRGAKSLLPIGVSSITYYSAVTFSVEDDGQITVNGTNPNTSNGIVYQDIVTAKTQQTETRYTLPVGRYKIAGTGTNGLRFQVHCHDGTNTHELFSKSSSGKFDYTESLKSQYPYICWRILIVANSSFSNHVVKPMIWDAAITDSTFQPYSKTNRELTVENDSQQSEINYSVNTGVKNLLSVNDGSGTNVRILSQSGIIKSGNYVMSFKASGFSGNYALSFYDANGVLIGNGSLNGAITADKSVSFTLSQDAYTVKFFIRGTATITELMLRPAAITDPTFQPYALPNPTLTPAAIKAVDEGAKNLLLFDALGSSKTNTGTSIQINGITFTIQNDHTITAYGTATSGAYMFFYLNGESENFVDLFDGKHIWSGLPEGYTSNEVSVFYKVDGGSSILINPVSGTLPSVSGTKVTLGIQVQRNQSYTQENPLIIKPMICTAADYAISPAFVPYAPTNRELYETCETKVTMQQAYGDAIPIPANSDLNNYTTPGIYYTLVTNAPTITNTPYNATGFRVVVEKNTLSGEAVFQTIYPTSRQRLEFFRRVYEGGTWSSWYKFEGIEVT